MKQIGGKICLILCLSLFLTACLNGRQGNYYQSYLDPLNAENVIPLADGETPELIISKDIETDRQKYQNLGFVIIGQSEFDTTDEKRYLRRNVDSHAQRAIEQAKKVHATHILYLRIKTSEYMETTSRDGKYETEHFERFKNVSVYMVRELE